jgi:signal peptidase II
MRAQPAGRHLVRFGLLVALAALAVDQASKWVMILWVMNPPRVIPLTGFFNLVSAWNTGVSFSLFANGPGMTRWLLVALAVAIIGFMLAWLRKADHALLASGLGLVIGGAVGNVIDRFVHGAVKDFLDFYIGQWHWPAFNFADAFISVGVALIVLDSFRRREPAPLSEMRDQQ